MPFSLFPLFDIEAEAAKAKMYWDQYCDQYLLLDGEPFHTGPEWIYVEIQGEAPDHNLPCWHYPDKKIDSGFCYLPCHSLKTGVTIHVRMREWGTRSPPNRFSQGDRFKTIEWIDNAMEVLAWVRHASLQGSS